jgi:prepilin peptidase CpaA
MFRHTDGTLIAGAIFTALLLVAGWSDFRSRRIPNRLVVLLTIAGFAFSMTAMFPAYGFGFAVGGLFAGFLIWLPFHVLGWIGAGDVKLAAACGAWLGFHGIIRASVAGAVVGGALALAMLLYQRSLRHVATDLILLVNSIRHQPSSLRVSAGPSSVPKTNLMPYGVALVIGALAVAWTAR